jgi:triphosphatase
MEVEAKLETKRPAVLEALARRKRLAGYEVRAIGSRDLETIYLDTESGDLLRRGIAVRLRRADGGVELTLKTRGEARGALYRRPETTWRLRRMPRLPFRPAGRAGRELSRWTGGAPLAARIGTRTRRCALLVRRLGGSAPVAEIDLDRVQFFRPGAPQGPPGSGVHLYEVEVELLGGDERDLNALVRELRSRYELRASRKSKLERALSWSRTRARRSRR